MIEAIQVAGLDPAKIVPGASPVQSPQASAIDVRQFSEAMQRIDTVAKSQQTAPVANTQPSEGTKAFMHAIDSLNGGADSVEAMAKSISSSPEGMTPSKMIEMTMACHQFMFQTQITSNVANRTSDGIQQLFRQQS